MTACFKHPLAFGDLIPGSTMTQCTYNSWTPAVSQCKGHFNGHSTIVHFRFHSQISCFKTFLVYDRLCFLHTGPYGKVLGVQSDQNLSVNFQDHENKKKLNSMSV